MAKIDNVIIHFEFQTRDSTDKPMPHRIAGYAGRGIETYGMPIYSHVIYLHPNAGRNDPGIYIQEMQGYNILIQYKVIRLSELDGKALLDSKVKGLIPFTPLMKTPDHMSSEEWFRQCVQVAKVITEGEQKQADYITSLGILGGLILDYEIVGKIISEETMQESSVIQHFTQQALQQGIQQGKREGLIDAILEILEENFQSQEVISLKNELENIQEPQHLKQLLRVATRIDNLNVFKKTLEGYLN